ncbi:zinc-finger domain-containing protein [Neobacillus citreus]|uniref:Zinc-finger domain-containing protein n=1 Tax=Neobacillus citreus TaxID=2833578 RepID=A0A942T369_9BACI
MTIKKLISLQPRRWKEKISLRKRLFYNGTGCLIFVKESARKALFTQVEHLLNEYCEGCFVHRQLKREGGRRTAHRFCISQCTVGQKIQEYGKKLT